MQFTANTLEDYWMPFTANRDFKDAPRLVVKSEGVYIWDHKGGKILDGSSGLFNVALGLASRLAPAIQIFFIAQPLNLLLGITLFAAILGALLTAFAAAMAAWLQNGWS